MLRRHQGIRVAFLLPTLLALQSSFAEAQGPPAATTPASGKADPRLNLQPLAVSKTYSPGTPSVLPGAPPLPSTTLDVSKFPTLDKVPPIDSPVVKEWLAKIDLTKAPSSKPTQAGLEENSANKDAVADAGPDKNCWWTSSGCTRDSDITTCHDKGSWGASYDDGPSEYTPNLLEYLDHNKLKATFFIVGSRAISLPEVLKATYMASHQLCLHSWSHPAMTTLTNEQIVAELAWNMKAFKDILGVVPICFRPPYGDVDDRVRYIVKAMGLQMIIWTRTPEATFDTNDWKVVSGTETPESTLKSFQDIITKQATMSTGFIVLAHDLYPQTVAFSMKYVVPEAIKSGLKIMPIATCLGGQLSATFVETANSSTAGSPTASATNSTTGANATTSSNSISTPSTVAVSTNTTAARASSGTPIIQIPYGAVLLATALALYRLGF